MSVKPGAVLHGIRSAEDLKLRCWVDEDTGCWHWRGATDKRGYPSVYIPAIRGTGSLGCLIGILRTGERPRKGVYWYCTCTTKDCANPEHRKPGNRKQQMQRTASKPKTLAHRLHMAAAKRAKSTKCSEQIAASIRSSTETLKQAAARTGLSIDACSKIRRGALWAPLHSLQLRA